MKSVKVINGGVKQFMIDFVCDFEVNTMTLMIGIQGKLMPGS